MRRVGLPVELERRRKLAVKRHIEGYSTSEIGHFLDVDPSTVRKWRRSYDLGGMHALDARPVPGRPRKLTQTEEKIVLRWLCEEPTFFGFASELWTCARVCELIEEEFGTRFNEHYVAAWLRARGITPQMPQRVPRERELAVIVAWSRRIWPRILRKAEKKANFVAFIDESGVMLQPLLRRSWAPKGHPPPMLQQGQRQKVSIAGALWFCPQSKKLGLFTKTLVDSYFNSEYSAYFLEALVMELDGPITIIWDRGNMHRGDPIKQVLTAYKDKLVLESLPSYAPMLNPIEFLWSWLKYGRLCNFAADDISRLTAIVKKELNSIKDNQRLLQSFFCASQLPSPRALLS